MYARLHIFVSMKMGIRQAAKELGVSRDTLRRWEKSGKIKVERTLKRPFTKIRL